MTKLQTSNRPKEMTATRTTAFFAGVWCVSGLMLVDHLEATVTRTFRQDRILEAIGAVIFFFVPFFVYVIGPQLYFLIPWRRRLTGDYWRKYPQKVIRVVCWFLGGCAVPLTLYVWRVITR